MTRNTFGNLFTLTTFGESHGEAVGGPRTEQYHHFQTGSRQGGTAQWCV